MKLTNAEIFNVKEPLMLLSKEKLPVKTSLAVLRLIRKLDEFLIPVETVRDGLIRTYGKETKEGNFTVMPGDENWSKFNKEYGELMTQTSEVVFEVVTLPDTLEIEPATLMALERFIKVA
uniref:Uncharacterized protein n=1 Tax=viral metagenome TaxID=1070528 RepID=A0A6M3KVN9_9ZZZZ